MLQVLALQYCDTRAANIAAALTRADTTAELKRGREAAGQQSILRFVCSASGGKRSDVAAPIAPRATAAAAAAVDDDRVRGDSRRKLSDFFAPASSSSSSSETIFDVIVID